MAKKKKKKLKKNSCFGLLLIIIVIGLIVFYVNNKNFMQMKNEAYLASDVPKITLYNENKESVLEVVRGKEIDLYINQVLELDENYLKIKYDDKEYYVNKDNIVYDKKEVVKESEVYVRTSYNLNEDLDGVSLSVLCNKGDKLLVTGYDKLNDDGTVNMYEVETSDGTKGYFYQKYVVSTEDEALKNYDVDGIYKIHSDKKDNLGGGDGASLDYYPVIKPTFEDNKMPDNVYSLYLNGTKSVIGKVDEYIEYAKTTKINAFVVDIKDSGVSAYKSPVMKELTETSYKNAQNSLEAYQEAIKKIKDAGFYVIGRITTFKDTYFINDHKEYAISNKDGSPMYHQSSYWPSAYNREVWEYNLLLAKEAVTLMGFNEIQFDYVRFPDGLRDEEKANIVDYKNTYNETTAQAIQRFLMYVTNELHKLNVYVSCDVFGESSSGYITAYGQYWPAISNVVDVISAMPYTDHFSRTDSSYWTNPYNTMKTWGKTAIARQKEISTPAIARTWITAYNTPYWKPTVTYNGEKLTDQIKALYEVGLDGGYMTWKSDSSLTKYKAQKSAFDKEYE